MKLTEHAQHQIRRGILPAVEGYSKKQIKAFLNSKLRINGEWAKKACLVIFDQQTNAEKNSGISNGHNGIGFNKNDAPVLTGIARKIKNKRSLTGSEIEKLKHRMPKYACQVAHLSDRAKLKKALAHYYN